MPEKEAGFEKNEHKSDKLDELLGFGFIIALSIGWIVAGIVIVQIAY